MISAACAEQARRPSARISFDMPCGAPASKKAGWPSSVRSDWCTWLDEPAARVSYFAMKVTARPFDQAISLTAVLDDRVGVGGGRARRRSATLISSCPALASPLELSTGMPARVQPGADRPHHLLLLGGLEDVVVLVVGADRGEAAVAGGVQRPRRTARNRKNSSSEAIIASSPCSRSRAIWRFSIARGECGTSAWPWWSSTSQSTSAVPGSQGTRRSVARSGLIV